MKHLWLPQKIKECALQMDGVPTTLNIADLGTKRLSKARRDFLMYLIGLVEYDNISKSCVPVGGDAFNSHLQKEALGKAMKSVRQVIVHSLMDGVEDMPRKISKLLVKAVTIMALQPLAQGARRDYINYMVMVRNFNLLEVMFSYQMFMVFYALVFMVLEIFLGYYFKKGVYKVQLSRVLTGPRR